MQVKEHHVVEFQRLYKKVYKEDISLDEALEQCIAMVNLNRVIQGCPFLFLSLNL